VDESTYFRNVRGLAETEQGQSLTGQYFTVQKQAYYETMAVRLYRYHGSAASTTDVPGTQLPGGQIPVVDWQETEVELNDGSEANWNIPAMNDNGTAQTIRLFDNMSAADEFVEEDGTAQIGGLGKIPSEPVPALQHYRLVQVSEQQQSPFMASQPGLATFAQSQQYTSGVSQQLLPSFAESAPAWTKVFERVPGATVEGTGPINETVTASVEMEMPNANSTFTYRQHAETNAEGEFNMTLPYSTTGYENWGPENGHTNVSVRANGSYQFNTPTDSNESNHAFQHRGSANVTEAQVIGTDDEPVEVTLEREDLGAIGDGNDTTGDETTGNDSDANASESLGPADHLGQTETGADGAIEQTPSMASEPLEAPISGGGVAR
ncbi:MAG: oligosaccharyl transferase, archaeosortase A system-associated, partial [Halorhabdus sp.]